MALCVACRTERQGASLPDADAPAEMSVEVFGHGAATVVEVRWREAIDLQGRPHAEKVAAMLDAALAGLPSIEGSFHQWASPLVEVGIKVNSVDCQAFTHPEVAAVLAGRLVQAGAAQERVTVWDRDSTSLVARGYLLDPQGAQGFACRSTDRADRRLAVPILVGGHTVELSPLLVATDVLINVAALKDHSMAGVSLCLKNNFGMLLAAERLHGAFREGSGCEPAISDLAARPEIRDRLGLCVLDALVGVCDGGPGPVAPGSVFRYGGILVSRDPVAIDRRGLSIIEARRAQLGLVPLSQRKVPNPSPPIHIENAAAKDVSPA